MRINPTALLAALLFAGSAFAQDSAAYTIALRSGKFIPERDISEERVSKFNQLFSRNNLPTYLLIQFDQLPDAAQKKSLALSGIELLEYVPSNTYTAVVRGGVSSGALARAQVRSLITLQPEQKMMPQLAAGLIPPRIVKVPGKIDLWITYPQTIRAEEVHAQLAAEGIEVLPTLYARHRIVAVRIAGERLKELAALNFVEFVQPVPANDVELNDKSKNLSRANVLQSSVSGGRNLRGEGVAVGIGDNASVTTHMDFTGRLINRSTAGAAYHGTHVTGTIGGGGIMRERYAGYAPKSTIISQVFSNILAYAPVYIQDHGMVITNNSYGNTVDDCTTFGQYDLYSRIMDEFAFAFPNLQNVFAAGNSGEYHCAPYPPSYRTVLGAYQSSKNVICVGSESEVSEVHLSSSRGPVADGRIKPEIVAQGVSVYSTVSTNSYGYNTGTSMAAPAVSGGLALLVQRYRQLFSNTNPSNALMKALLCNGAADVGRPGPDFFYGFGEMDLLRSVKMLENGNYRQSSVSAGSNKEFSITIPAGSNLAQLKVMLYWNDLPAAMLSAKTLVNDLDLELVQPGNAVVLPYILDATSGNVNKDAVRGADHVNNIEQVVVPNPAPGNYTLRVKGTTLPFGASDFVLVYDTLPVSTTITYPMGGEHFSAGDSIYISWKSYGSNTNDFSLQYSVDGGATWPVTIAANIPANQGQYKWFVPEGNTDRARIRVIRNGVAQQSTSGDFTVIGTPVVSLSPVQCEGYFAIQWNAVADATDYEIMLLRDDEMLPIATTTGTSYVLSGLSRDSSYFVGVRARINGSPGWRSLTISRQPNGGTCAGAISNGDLKVDAITSPARSGRKFTSTELSATNTISVRIKNLDDIAVSGSILVSYSIGAGVPVTETLTTSLTPGGVVLYTFATRADMSAVGNYPITVSISHPGDPVKANDTLRAVFRQLDNAPLDVTDGWLDDIEAAPVQTYTSRQTGMIGLDRYDFVGSTQFGRIRTFINSGMAYSGNRAITLDADRRHAGTVDSLTATFNLQNYNIAADDIRFDFRFKHHGQTAHNANKVWVRGNDTAPWIEAYNLFSNQADAGVFKLSASIELQSLLLAAGQSYSSSSQVRFGQWGAALAADNETAAGYTFDDIHLYQVTNDIQMVTIDTPATASCGLGNLVPVRVTVRNSSAATITNIPVRLQVDGGSVVTEIIPAIAGKAIVTYTFTATADFSAFGTHDLFVWVDLPSDTYRDNDSASVRVINSPIVNTFPYLQNFETDEGFWRADGRRSSWQYGTPVSARINKAASGNMAWKTGLLGNYNDGEFSFLYSPCFDISSLANPVLSFSLALDIEDCGASICDGAYVEYSADGKVWTRLGSSGAGTNWYNKNIGGNQLWSIQNYGRWHVATIPLPAGLSRLRLRFVMQADAYTSREGIAIDDIHIYDRQFGIFELPPSASAVITQANVSGSSWTHFTDGGRIIASINPAGQNMGNTNVQAFIHTGPVRNSKNQYYHNRNITIKPVQTVLADSVVVRFYFTDPETELLLNAAGCSLCSKPASAYELGVSKYSNPNKALENGTLTDNTGGSWHFINNAVKVPYDKGYYAEFRVKDFSEFWLNHGGPDNNQPLPVELLDFTALKSGANDVKIDWRTASEINSAYYDIEVAKGNAAMDQQSFSLLARITSDNNANGAEYSFTDKENNKSGVRYYRLKMVDVDGVFRYSGIRPVVFDEEISWQLYPNPSNGMFNLICQAQSGEKIDISIYDVNGRQVKKIQQHANGFVQKVAIDLTRDDFMKGVYMLEVRSASKSSSFRMIKL